MRVTITLSYSQIIHSTFQCNIILIRSKYFYLNIQVEIIKSLFFFYDKDSRKLIKNKWKKPYWFGSWDLIYLEQPQAKSHAWPINTAKFKASKHTKTKTQNSNTKKNQLPPSSSSTSTSFQNHVIHWSFLRQNSPFTEATEGEARENGSGSAVPRRGRQLRWRFVAWKE